MIFLLIEKREENKIRVLTRQRLTAEGKVEGSKILSSLLQDQKFANFSNQFLSV